MIRVSLLILLCAMIFTGCATMYATHDDDITIKSEPPGAEVYLGAELLGTTPFTHRFERDTFAEPKIQIRKAGYRSREIKLKRTIEKTALFNFGFITTTFGVTSWGIDAGTGALIRYYPNSYFVELFPLDTEPENGSPNRGKRLRFVLLNYDYIKRDISRGGGEYLRAYYSMLEGSRNWNVFMERIYRESGHLLAHSDAVDFYQTLEAAQVQ